MAFSLVLIIIVLLLFLFAFILSKLLRFLRKDINLIFNNLYIILDILKGLTCLLYPYYSLITYKYLITYMLSLV